MPQQPIDEMPAEPDLQTQVELLRQELYTLHDELTERTSERLALRGRLSALTLDVPDRKSVV